MACKKCIPYKFDHKTNAFSLENMQYLAFMSNLAYDSERSIKIVLCSMEYDVENNFEFFHDDYFDTQAFVVADDNKIIVSFRGSESLTDWKFNFKFFKTKWNSHCASIRVHKGIYWALRSIWGKIYKKINDLDQPSRKICFTGHSLGGTLATLAAANYLTAQSKNLQDKAKLTEAIDKIHGIYTFAQSRVGNCKFKTYFNKHLKEKTFRCVNNNDFVTKLPQEFWGYHHVGKLVYINSKEKILPPDAISEDELKIDRRYKNKRDSVGDHSMYVYEELIAKNIK